MISFDSITFTSGWTQSEITMLDQCPQKWYYRYAQRMSKRGEFNMAFAFGSAWHKSLEGWYQSKGKNEVFADLQTFVPVDALISLEDEQEIEYQNEVLRIMLTSYYHHYAHDHSIFKPKNVELKEDVTIEVDGQELRLLGLIDLEGIDFIMDHKTTALLNLAVTEGWDWKFQFFWYAWLARKSRGNKIKAFYVNALKKPQIRQTQKESLGQFGQRLLADMTERFSKYFYRQEIEITDDLIEKFEEQVLMPKFRRMAMIQNPETPEAVLEVLTQNRNTNECHVFNRRCEFYGICTHQGDMTNFITRQKKHTEYDNE